MLKQPADGYGPPVKEQQTKEIKVAKKKTPATTLLEQLAELPPAEREKRRRNMTKEEKMKLEEEEAAAKIQARFRGKNTRKSIKQLAAEPKAVALRGRHLDRRRI